MLKMADKLCDALLQCIDASYHIEIHLGRDKTWNGNAWIVLKLNEKPLFTINLGPSEEHFCTFLSVKKAAKISAVACTALALGSSFFVNEFEISKTTTLEKILEFALSSGDDRFRALSLVLELAKVEMGNFSILKNSFGDLVAKALNIILSNKTRHEEDEEDCESYGSPSKEYENRGAMEFLQRVGNDKKFNAITIGLATGAVVFGIGYGVCKAIVSNNKNKPNKMRKMN